MMVGNHTLPRPVVSVILPTFNRLQYLRAAVDSVFAQTYEDWELIIADDGSEEETGTYLRSLAQKAKVRVLWLAHSGFPGAVRNVALREAQGEYIAFLDSDDVWMPAKLELQLATLRARPNLQWSYTAINHIDHAGAQINAAISTRWVWYEGQIFEHLLTLKAGIAMPTVVVGRQLLEQVGGFDEHQEQHEDYHLWLRLAMRNEIGVLRQPLACVRVHNEHFSEFGIPSLEARYRMLAKIQALVANSSQRAAVRTARARNAALLAGSTAAAGRSDDAWRVITGSWRFSWRCTSWWVAVTTVVAHVCLPARLKTTIREYRRAARRASLF
jgi:glycosyltransferase involved in cell wall biosynthesis